LRDNCNTGFTVKREGKIETIIHYLAFIINFNISTLPAIRTKINRNSFNNSTLGRNRDEFFSKFYIVYHGFNKNICAISAAIISNGKLN